MNRVVRLSNKNWVDLNSVAAIELEEVCMTESQYILPWIILHLHSGAKLHIAKEAETRPAWVQAFKEQKAEALFLGSLMANQCIVEWKSDAASLQGAALEKGMDGNIMYFFLSQNDEPITERIAQPSPGLYPVERMNGWYWEFKTFTLC